MDGRAPDEPGVAVDIGGLVVVVGLEYELGYEQAQISFYLLLNDLDYHVFTADVHSYQDVENDHVDNDSEYQAIFL